MLTATVTTLSTNAQTAGDVTINAGDCKSISLANDMDVVVTTSESTADFLVSREAAAGLDVRMSGGTLYVEQKCSAKKATIHITVRSLEQLGLGANTVVHVQGLLSTPALQLFIDNNARAYIKTTGLVIAHSTGDAGLSVEPLRPNGRTDRIIFN